MLENKDATTAFKVVQRYESIYSLKTDERGKIVDKKRLSLGDNLIVEKVSISFGEVLI